MIMLLAIIILVATRTAFAQISGAERDQFVMATVNICTATTEKTAQSIGAIASHTVIASYCICLAHRSAAIATHEDSLYMHQHGDFPEALRARVIADIIPICRAEATK
jgi:hypothetical protein